MTKDDVGIVLAFIALIVSVTTLLIVVFVEVVIR